MNLEDRLRQLKRASGTRDRNKELEQTLEYLRRLENSPSTRKLPAQRFAKGVRGPWSVVRCPSFVVSGPRCLVAPIGVRGFF